MALSVGRAARAATVSDQPWGVPTAAGSSELTPWIAIAPDDTVTIRDRDTLQQRRVASKDVLAEIRKALE